MEPMLAQRIPNIVSIGPPATHAQIDALAAALGLELPEQYRTLLAEANGFSASLVQMFPVEDVPAVNATYEVAEYAPNYLVIGTINDFPVLLHSGPTSPVFENDWGAMTPDCMEELAPTLVDWIERGCPGRNGRTTAD